jgi:hypothetical protein
LRGENISYRWTGALVYAYQNWDFWQATLIWTTLSWLNVVPSLLIYWGGLLKLNLSTIGFDSNSIVKISGLFKWQNFFSVYIFTTTLPAQWGPSLICRIEFHLAIFCVLVTHLATKSKKVRKKNLRRLKDWALSLQIMEILRFLCSKWRDLRQVTRPVLRHCLLPQMEGALSESRLTQEESISFA